MLDEHWNPASYNVPNVNSKTYRAKIIWSYDSKFSNGLCISATTKSKFILTFGPHFYRYKRLPQHNSRALPQVFTSSGYINWRYKKTYFNDSSYHRMSIKVPLSKKITLSICSVWAYRGTGELYLGNWLIAMLSKTWTTASMIRRYVTVLS